MTHSPNALESTSAAIDESERANVNQTKPSKRGKDLMVEGRIAQYHQCSNPPDGVRGRDHSLADDGRSEESSAKVTNQKVVAGRSVRKGKIKEVHSSLSTELPHVRVLGIDNPNSEHVFVRDDHPKNGGLLMTQSPNALESIPQTMKVASSEVNQTKPLSGELNSRVKGRYAQYPRVPNSLNNGKGRDNSLAVNGREVKSSTTKAHVNSEGNGSDSIHTNLNELTGRFVLMQHNDQWLDGRVEARLPLMEESPPR